MMFKSQFVDALVVALIVAAGCALVYSQHKDDDTGDRIVRIRQTITDLTRTREDLSKADRMLPVNRIWTEAVAQVKRCGVKYSVMENDDRKSLYKGVGQTWGATMTGKSIEVVNCAYRLSELPQIVFERVLMRSAERGSATIAFTVYGQINAHESRLARLKESS